MGSIEIVYFVPRAESWVLWARDRFFNRDEVEVIHTFEGC